MSGARSEGKPWLQSRSGQHIDLGKLRAGMCQPAGAGWWRIRPRRACWRREGKFRPAGDDRTFREQLVVTNDAAWAAISEKNNAMLSARLAVMAGGRRARGGLLGGFGAPGVVPGSRGPGVPPRGGPWWSRPSWPACSAADRGRGSLAQGRGEQCARSRYPSRFGDSACRTQGQERRPCKSAGMSCAALNPRQNAQKGEPRGL